MHATCLCGFMVQMHRCGVLCDSIGAAHLCASLELRGRRPSRRRRRRICGGPSRPPWPTWAPPPPRPSPPPARCLRMRIREDAGPCVGSSGRAGMDRMLHGQSCMMHALSPQQARAAQVAALLAQVPLPAPACSQPALAISFVGHV